MKYVCVGKVKSVSRKRSSGKQNKNHDCLVSSLVLYFIKRASGEMLKRGVIVNSGLSSVLQLRGYSLTSNG